MKTLMLFVWYCVEHWARQWYCKTTAHDIVDIELTHLNRPVRACRRCGVLIPWDSNL